MPKGKKTTAKKTILDKNIYIILSLVVVLTFILFLVNQNSTDKGRVLAKIDNKKIYETDLVNFLAATYNVAKNFDIASLPVEQQKDIIKQYYTENLVLKAANKSGLAKDPEIAQKITDSTNKILKEALLEQIALAASDRAAVEAYYQSKQQELAKELEGKEEVKASHILVKEKAEADKVYFSVKNGKKDFAEIAAEKSIDQFSGKNGGDLGFFTEEKMVPEFAKQAFATKVGQISRPFKTQFGWHIVKVTDRRAAQVPSLDEMYDKLKQELSYQAVSDYIEELSQNLDVEVIRDFAPTRNVEAAPAAEADTAE